MKNKKKIRSNKKKGDQRKTLLKASMFLVRGPRFWIFSGQSIVSFRSTHAMTRKVKFWSWKKTPSPNRVQKSDSAEQRHAIEVAKIQRWLELADSALKSSKNSRSVA